MPTYEIECAKPWYRFLETGEKPLEGRKATPKWSPIAKGDTIIFSDGEGHSFRAAVVGVNRYEGRNCLRKFLETETLARALPGVQTIEEGMRIYCQWSTMEEIEKYGFLGIQVQVVQP